MLIHFWCKTLKEANFVTVIGPDWKWNNQDGGAGNIGTVYRLKTETEIYVWILILVF